MNLRVALLPAFAVLLAAPAALAATLQVGPGKAYAKPCAANAAAKDGDVIEIDAAGDYHGDVCQWSQNGITLRGVNGRAKIDATGTSISNGKGIWVFYGDTTTVENIEFVGAKVNDGNGAGIRHQGLNLTVRNCSFHDNENGILGGPLANGQNADGQGEVLIELSEFAHNGKGDGQTHNMYLNHYAKFTLRYSWSHASNVGHLVKSRALESHVLYNRLSDDDSTNVSYEINLPNGGKAFVIGNVIEQGADPNGEENGAIVDFGSEGPVAGSALYVVNNTLLNNRKAGTFVQVNGGVTTPSVLRNNVFSGPGTVCNQASAVLDHNFSSGDPKLVDPAQVDFHLQAGSPCAEAGADPGSGEGQSLAPVFHYVHPASYETRKTVGVIDVGAYELGGGGGAGGGTGGSTSSSSSSSSGGTTTGTGTGTGSGGAANGTGGAGGGGGGSDTGSKSGCGCRVGGEGSAGGAAAALLALGLLARRRRARS